MDNVANASINSFLPAEQQADVPQSEEPVFILTSSQLQEIITRAIQPALDRIDSLEATIARQDEKIAALEATQDTQSENQLIQLRLIHDLREATKKEAQPLQKDRGEVLQALLAANGGKMLAKDARQKMRLDKVLFSQLLARVEDIEIRPYKLDKRQKLLVLK